VRKARRIFLTSLICAGTYLTTQAQYASVNEYLKRFAPLAIELSAKTGIPSSVILGVAIIESGYGNSKNCKLLKNHFGIVGKNHLEQTQTTYRSMYKAYQADEDSYRDFCRIIVKKKFFAEIKGRTDHNLWLQKMCAANYSSAKMAWVNKIAYAIEKHQLNRFNVIDNIAKN